MINDYATLQQAIADELARADLTASIPTFIQLAEADFNRDLRVRQMQVVVTGTSTGQNIPIPADMLELQGLFVTFGGIGVEIFPMPPEALSTQLVTGGPSAGYVVVGSNITLIGGAGDVAYTLLYFQQIPSIATTQNWLILKEPGLYLYGALTHSAPYLRDDSRIVVWGSISKAIRDGMQIKDDSSRYGNAPAMQSGYRNAP